MTKKKRTDLRTPVERGPRVEVRIGERVEDIGGEFDSLDEAKACFTRKRRLDRVCYIWDRHKCEELQGSARCLYPRRMDSEITSAATQRLLGVSKVALNDLAKRGIVKLGERKGTYAVEASVRGYCRHLREQAAGPAPPRAPPALFVPRSMSLPMTRPLDAWARCRRGLAAEGGPLKQSI